MTAVGVSVVPEFSAVEIARMTGFSFADRNWQCRKALCQSWFGELPEFVGDIVRGVVGLRPMEWDELVARDAVLEVTGPGRWTVPRSLPCVRKQLAGIPEQRSGVCPTCAGTCITIDEDGSFTGCVGTPVLCVCLGAL